MGAGAMKLFAKKIQEKQRQKKLHDKVSKPRQFLTTQTPRARTQAPQAMEDYLQYGMGPQKKFYTNAGAGTMSMSPLASTDSLVAKLGADLGGLQKRYADGGKVTMTAQAMKVIKDALSQLQSKERAKAVATLRNSREAMSNPRVGRAADDLTSPTGGDAARKSLLDLVEQHTNQTKMATMAGGGEVQGAPMEGNLGDADPQALYAEYQELEKILESGQLDDQQEMMILNQMQQIEQVLQAMGIDVSAQNAEADQGQEEAPDIQGMMQQLTQGAGGLGIQ
jgi:hypothetical protein